MEEVEQSMADNAKQLPQHIAETVDEITQLHAEHHRHATPAERLIDRITQWVGRPFFLFALMALAAAWIAFNLLLDYWGATPLDPPPFKWTELAFAMMAVLVAVLILASQSRADRLANLREQMTLEATLMSEKKVRKIIDLLEELRRDSPQVRDRPDPEATQMSAKDDPHQVLNAIEESADQAVHSVDPSAKKDTKA